MPLSQYVAFAGFSAVLNLFVRGHHLSTETNDVVLGVDRRKPETGQSGSDDNQPNQEMEHVGVQENKTQPEERG